MKKAAFSRIITFYLIAIIVSNVFRFDLLHLQGVIDSLPTWAMLIYSPLQAIGIVLGALIAMRLLHKQTTLEFSIFGTSKKWSVIMSIIPVMLLTILGLTNKQGTNSHYVGFIAGLSTFIYCYFEEIGWRGYLEQELKGISAFKRVLIIAGLWYLWHLYFLRNTDLVQNILFFGWLLLGSWGLGKIIQITKSIFAATCFHMVINILLFNGFIKEDLNSSDKMIVLGVLIPVWILILIIWKKETTRRGFRVYKT